MTAVEEGQRNGNFTTQRSLVTGALLLYVALVSASAATKLPINDEGWYGQPAFRLAGGQSMGTPALENSGVHRFQGLQEHTYWIMPLFIVVQAGLYKVIGAGLLQMRLLSALCGLGLIVSWYFIERALLQDRWIATLALAFLAVDFDIIAVCATGRSDAMCAALGAAGLALYLVLRRRNLVYAVLGSQSLIVASGLTHPYGFYYFVALLYLILHFDRRSLKWRVVALGLIPYVIGTALWVSYIAKSPADFVAQFGNNASERSWVLKHPTQALLAEIGRYRDAYGFSANATASRRLENLILLAYLAGVVGVLATRSLRRNPKLRPLLVLSGLFFLELTFLEGAKQPWYLIHLIPCLSVLLAVFLIQSWRSSAWPGKRVLATAAIGVALLNIGATAGLSYRDGYHTHYARVINFLKRRSPEPAKVMGGTELGFGLGFDLVKDDYELGFHSGWRPSWIVIGGGYRAQFDLFRQWRPEVWRFVQHRLNDEYAKVFDDGYYTVYALPSRRPESSDVNRAQEASPTEVLSPSGRSN